MLNPLAEPMLPTPYRVLKVGRETTDTFTLALAPANGEAGFTFAPGQFNMLYVFGVGEAPISISGDPDRPETLVHTVRAVGAVSRAICGLKKGGTLGVRGPFGTPWRRSENPSCLAFSRREGEVCTALGMGGGSLVALVEAQPLAGRVDLLQPGGRADALAFAVTGLPDAMKLVQDALGAIPFIRLVPHGMISCGV